MKRFCFMLAVLLSFAGTQTTRARKFEPVDGELYVITSGNRFVVDNPDHQCSILSGHPDQLCINYEEGNYHELFYINGDSVSGYTIRPASRPDHYVYAVCDDTDQPLTNVYGGVGVKEVSGEPGDECIWYITYASGFRLAPKLNPNAFVSTTWFLKGHVCRHPVMRDKGSSLSFLPLANAMASLYSNGYQSPYQEVVAAEVEKLKQQGVNATTWTAFKEATDEALALTFPAGGWYRIKSLAVVDEEEGATSKPYLYSNTEAAEGGELYSVLGNRQMTPGDGRYIWKLSPFSYGIATIKGSSGKGFNFWADTSNDYDGISLTHVPNTNSYHITAYSESRWGNAEFQYGQSEEGCGKVSDTDWALTCVGEASFFEFEQVEESALPGEPYMVGVNAPQNLTDRVRVEYVGSEDFTGHHSVGNGGYFFLKSAPTADDFRATEIEGYRCGIVVGDGRVTVTYAESDYDGRYFCIGRRAETLESGKQYAIFNTAMNIETSENRMALLYIEKRGSQMLCGGVEPYPGTVVSAGYAWTLTQGSAPDLWTIKSEVRPRYVGWNGDDIEVSSLKGVEMRITEWTDANPDWREINVMSLNDDGTFTANSKISEANHVWTIGRINNTMFWNGESATEFATWVCSHPYAFYELTEISFPDGIADVKAAEHRQSRGTYDLQGRRVHQTHKGIYIQDGRKIVVK